jgi:ATP-dependent protease HslVU (ClpYQ) ATPase subunit
MTTQIDPHPEDNKNFLNRFSKSFGKVLDKPNYDDELFQEPPLATFLWLYKKLINFTIGQDTACFDIALTMTNHFLASNNKEGVFKIKTNPLIVGPTGVGKSSTISYAAELFDIPFVEFSLAHVTPAGIVGPKLVDSLKKLINSTDFDFKLASDKKWIKTIFEKGLIDKDTKTGLDEGDRVIKKAVTEIVKISKSESGIIFIDEFDKCFPDTDRNSTGLSESIQNELLDLLGGGKVPLPDVSHNDNATEVLSTFNTSNVMFFMAGTFKLQAGDMPSFNLEKLKGKVKDELLGRIGVPIKFNSLDDEHLRQVFEHPTPKFGGKSLRQIIEDYVKVYFPKFVLNDCVVNYMIKLTNKNQLGARYLINQSNSIANQILRYLFRSEKVNSNTDIIELNENDMKILMFDED